MHPFHTWNQNKVLAFGHTFVHEASIDPWEWHLEKKSQAMSYKLELWMT